VKFNSTVEDLYKVLKSKKVKDVISATKLFDDQFFAVRQYAVLFSSQSIQPSSYEHPRILLFGKDNEMRVGINHHIGKKRNLKIIQYRKKDKVWELREIKFDNDKVSLTRANPPVCMSCHGDKKVLPSFKGKLAQINEYKMNYLMKGEKPDVLIFKKSIKGDPIYSRLKNLEMYLGDLGF
jgi:hypothetical protein